MTYFPNDVKHLHIKYECEWTKFKRENALEMEAFWTSTGLPKQRPLARLTPRATLRGGFIELYRLKFSTEDHPNWTLHFGDVNSLYPYIGLTNQFPTGKYKILLHKDGLQKNIAFTNGEFFYKGQTMSGDAAFVKILAPSNLKRPYLSFRVNDEYNYLSLCRMCVLNKVSKHCTHFSENSRCFTSCYMISDLAMAVSLGYKILEWYEVHHYETRAFLLRDFVKVLALQKLKYSNILLGVPENEHIAFCDKINQTMGFQTDQCLSPDMICDNSAQKQLFKDMMNTFFGRFAQHTNYTKHYFCRNIHEIEILASKQNSELVDITSLSDDVCQIEVSNDTKVPPSQQGCLYITSEINSLARRFIYEKSQQVE